MRAALVALAAATSFFLSVFGLSDSGRPVPDGIEGGAAGERSTELAPLSPPVSLDPIDRVEEVEPLVRVKRIAALETPDEGVASIESDPPVFALPELPPPRSSGSDPQPTLPPAPEPSPSPSPSPLPSPSPTPTSTPSATPSPTAEPAP
jgi:hypothetical protein